MAPSWRNNPNENSLFFSIFSLRCYVRRCSIRFVFRLFRLCFGDVVRCSKLAFVWWRLMAMQMSLTTCLCLCHRSHCPSVLFRMRSMLSCVCTESGNLQERNCADFHFLVLIICTLFIKSSPSLCARYHRRKNTIHIFVRSMRKLIFILLRASNCVLYSFWIQKQVEVEVWLHSTPAYERMNYVNPVCRWFAHPFSAIIHHIVHTANH